MHTFLLVFDAISDDVGITFKSLPLNLAHTADFLSVDDNNDRLIFRFAYGFAMCFYFKMLYICSFIFYFDLN